MAVERWLCCGISAGCGRRQRGTKCMSMQADLPVQQVVAGLQDGAVGQLQVGQAVIRRREHHCRRRRRRQFLLRRLRGIFCWLFRGPSSLSPCRPPFLCGSALHGPCRPLAGRLAFLSRLPANGFFCCDCERRPPRQRCHQQGADAALRSAQLQLVSAPILLHVQALRSVTTADVSAAWHGVCM